MSCKIHHIGKPLPLLDICITCSHNPDSCGKREACANARTLTLDRALLGMLASDRAPAEMSKENARIFHEGVVHAQNAIYDMKATLIRGTLLRLLEDAKAVGGFHGKV